MKAADLMTTNVITIAEDETIQEAAALMLWRGSLLSHDVSPGGFSLLVRER